MKMNRLILIVTLLSAAQAGASIITWDTPQNISGPSDVLNSGGTFVEAYNVAGSATTLNGVTFAAASTLNSSGVIGGTVFTNTFLPSPATTGDATYDNLLRGAQAGATYMNLGKGGLLVHGQEYRVQIWVNDSRALANSRNTTFTTDTNTVIVDMNQGTEFSLGHWVTGTFTYDDTIRYNAAANELRVAISSNVSNGQLVNAYSLYAIPEPATAGLLLALVALAGVIARRRFRRD